MHYTHDYKNKIEELDHILESDQFYDHSPKRIWAYRDSRYWNDHLDDHDNSDVTTDHGIVSAEFDYRPLERIVEKEMERIRDA